MDTLIFLKALWRMRELKKHDRRPLAETLAIRDSAVSRLIQFASSSSPFYAEFHKGFAGAPLSELHLTSGWTYPCDG